MINMASHPTPGIPLQSEHTSLGENKRISCGNQLRQMKMIKLQLCLQPLTNGIVPTAIVL
jgi:hypothetical protein